MATQYSHPFEGIDTTDDLAAAFRDTFELDAEAHHGGSTTTVTVPLTQNWDVAAIEDLVDATPFDILGHDREEVTLVDRREADY